jgi:hypothetical protein
MRISCINRQYIMTEEEFLAAQIAGMTNSYMKNIMKGGTGDVHNIVGHHNRTDWRQLVANGQRRPQGQGQYQPDMHHPAAAGDYGDVPTEVSSQYGQIPLPRDAQGNVIVPPELRDPNMLPPSDGLNIGGFNVPSYGVKAAAVPNTEQYDTIIKEIKLLKRAVSTLTNLVKKSILANNPELLESTPASKEKEEKDDDAPTPAPKAKVVVEPAGLPSISFSSETKI